MAKKVLFLSKLSKKWKNFLKVGKGLINQNDLFINSLRF